MLTSPEINELAGALAKAQGQFAPAPRSGFNEFTNKGYATLADVVAVYREPLAANALALVQTPELTEGAEVVVVTSRLIHASGQWIEGTVAFPVVNKGRDGKTLPPDAQSVMMAITYARRAGASSLLNIAQDADDDGNAASGRKAPVSSRPAPDPNSPISPEQIAAITNICGKQHDPEGTVLDWYGCALAELTVSQGADCIARLQKAKKPQAATRN